MKVIVIGASHGGLEAVTALTERTDVTEIVWIDQRDIPALVGSELKNIPVERIKLFSHSKVTNVNPKKHMIEVQAGGKSLQESYDKLILGVGAMAAKLPVPGNQLAKIKTLRNRQDMNDLRQAALDPEINHVVVIGAGYIGIGAVEIFAAAGKKVTVIDVFDHPLATYLDSELTAVLAKEMTEHGVTLALGQRVEKFVGEGTVKEVVTDQATFSAELVVLSAGARPNTAWLKDAITLLPNGMIKTDDYMQTSEPDIFAIGDATTVYSNAAKQELTIQLATNAVRQGRFAVRNLTEKLHPFEGVQGSSGLKLFDYMFASTGLNTSASERFVTEVGSVFLKQKILDNHLSAPVNAEVLFKLFYDPKTLKILGAQILSKKDLTAYINTVSLAIQAGFTIEQLAYTDFFFQPLFNTPWNLLNQAGQQAMKQAGIV